MKQYFVYIASNSWNSVLYTGVTSNLERRIFEHRAKIGSKFTSKYNVNKLLWYGIFQRPEEAIAMEKMIKGWRRSKKIALIKANNPDFKDLNEGDPSIIPQLQ